MLGDMSSFPLLHHAVYSDKQMSMTFSVYQLLLILQLSTISECCQQSISSFLTDNGKHFINIITNDRREAHKFIHMVATNLLFVRWLHPEDFLEEYKFGTDFNVFCQNWDSINDTLKVVSGTKIKSTLIYLREKPKDNFSTAFSKLEQNALFYLAYPKGNISIYNNRSNNSSNSSHNIGKMVGNNNTIHHVLQWHQILNIQHQGQSQSVINNLKFINGSNTIKESYDLQNMTITSTSLTWAPYLMLDDCDSTSQSCSSSGFLIDLISLVAKEANFRLISMRNNNNSDWGTNPISGPYNLSGVWSSAGVMGSVLKGDYPLSLGQWFYTAERDQVVDFVSTTTDYMVLALTPHSPEVDLSFFLKPFTSDAWLAIVAVTVLIICILAAFNFKMVDKTEGYKVAEATACIFCLLVNAYYGGALTMFFSSEDIIQFEGIREVMRAYPEWKLLFMEGNEIFFQEKAKAGDPDFSIFWSSRMKQSAMSSITAGLSRLQKERAVLHVQSGMLKGHFAENPFHQQRLTVKAVGKPEFNALILTKNSPLTPVLKLGVERLRESGACARLLSNWEGRMMWANGREEVEVVSTGQMMLGFIFMGVAVVATGVILGVELLWRKED